MLRDEIISLDQKTLEGQLTEKVMDVLREPEYRWGDRFNSFMSDDEDRPVVRLAVGNSAIDMDIWEDLRSPALVGMFPLDFKDIWMHYAAAHVVSTRPDGSPNPLAMPEPYTVALQRYRRVILVSAMLVINPEVFGQYAEKIERGDPDPYDYYSRAQVEVKNIINKAVAKFSLSLMAPGRAVVPMTQTNVDKIADRTRSEYLSGPYHGPCNYHWPQNSIAVLTGLLRFGVSRLPFRDEVWEDGSKQRLFGRYASIVIFDEGEPRTGDMALIDRQRIDHLLRLTNYTVVSPEVVAQRYCTYNKTRKDGTSVCGKCLNVCPSTAIGNSSPRPDGAYPDDLLSQAHRFQGEALDFDHGNCYRHRHQQGQLYEEYVCARCEVICAARGIMKPTGEIGQINFRGA